MLIVEYPKCTTCKKAKKWLDDNGFNYTVRNIVENNPKYDELKTWVKNSKIPVRKFFNTSGLQYKQMGLKDKILSMNEDELLFLLSTNGMLVKRPLLISDDFILVGFKENEWKEKIK